MDTNSQELAGKTRKLIAMQAVIGLVVAAGFFSQGGLWAAASALYGTLVSMCLAVLLFWNVSRASIKAANDRGKSAAILYIGGAQRFFLVLALFGLGLAVLKVEPVGVVFGFCLSQVAHLVNLRRRETPLSDSGQSST